MKSLSNWEFTVVAHAAPQSALTDKVIHGILFGGLFLKKDFMLQFQKSIQLFSSETSETK